MASAEGSPPENAAACPPTTRHQGSAGAVFAQENLCRGTDPVWVHPPGSHLVRRQEQKLVVPYRGKERNLIQESPKG